MPVPELKDNPSPLRYIFLFWLPLAAMWLFMGLETPIINACIARMPMAKENLAAYGVTFSITVLIESPIIQMLTTGTALAADRKRYRQLIRFMHVMALILTALHLVLAMPSVYRFAVSRVMGIPEDIMELSRIPFLFLAPFHAAVGYRRLWQGVLIRYGKTREVTYIMIIRFISTVAILLAGFLFTHLNAALLGALSLSAGVLMGACSAGFFTLPIVKRLPEDERGVSVLRLKDLLRFYIPLLLTSLILMASRPILAAGISRGTLPLESLAVWPVIEGFVFVFRSLSMSYQEVVVALMNRKSMAGLLRRFAIFLAGGVGLLYLITAGTPLSRIWFQHVAGLDSELLPMALIPFLLALPVPVLSGPVALYRGILVHRGNTGTIAGAVIINSLSLAFFIFAGVAWLPYSGALIAAGALSLSLLIESIFLRIRVGTLPGALC